MLALEESERDSVAYAGDIVIVSNITTSKTHEVHLLIAESSPSIINAYKRFCALPLGTSMGWGSVIEKGRQVDTLVRTECIITDSRVVLYSLYKFAEKCNDYKEFTLAWLMNDSIDRDGVSPTRIFGIDYEKMKSILLGLSAKYPEFIDATFTNDLEKITIKDKTSNDVVELFKEAQ